MNKRQSTGKIIIIIAIIALLILYILKIFYQGTVNPLIFYYFMAAYIFLYIGALMVLPIHSYRTARNYLYESRIYFFSIFALFIVSAIIGFIFSSYFSFLDTFLRELVAQTTNLNGGQLISFIFLNNLESSFIGLFFGIIFGIIPVFVTLINGTIVGYVLARSWENSGITEFWRLFPHGIFELPAVFISLGLGVKLGGFVFTRNRQTTLLRRFYNSAVVFVLIVLPLLAIASVIEGVLIAVSS